MPEAPLSARRACALVLLAACLRAQAGDVAGEAQPALHAHVAMPPAPALSPEAEAATFVVAEGFVVELVAAEPLVHDPVAATFDEDGRLWVVEMRGYMRDADGTNELAPDGAIAVLHDDDHDGRFDRRTTFLDGLVLPRAVAPARGGALVIAPPDLLFCRDLDGDGRADQREVVDTGLGGRASPEHAINGLLWTLDNTFAVANAGVRYRGDGARWVTQPVATGGQWGLTQDDLGRLVFDTNADALRAHLVPPRFGVRHPAMGRLVGINVPLLDDQRVWPVRPTLGVNRAYRPGALREDGTLATVTSACGPWIARGHAWPDDVRGDAFVCEPAGNLVKRYTIDEYGNGGLRAEPAWEGRELLASTDERFRPVHLTEGPDGALYVVDMYRGVLQHRLFMTSWLRGQIDARGLETPVGLGRIWRVRAEGAPGPGAHPALSSADDAALVARLGHRGGWWRDTAQRLLVERAPLSAPTRARLEALVRFGASGAGRAHALWTLDGASAARREIVLGALEDGDRRVRHAAAQIAERWLGSARSGDDAQVHEALVARLRDPDGAVRVVAALALGEAEERAPLITRIESAADDMLLRGALLDGLRGIEPDALATLAAAPSWTSRTLGRDTALHALARAIARGDDAAARTRAVALAAALPPDRAWARDAIVRGLLAGRALDGRGRPEPLVLAAEPEGLEALRAARDGLDGPHAAPDGEAPEPTPPGGASPPTPAGEAPEPTPAGEAQQRVLELLDALAWPGHAAASAPAAVPSLPLTDDQHARFVRGRDLFARACASCHQESGLGEPGKAPALIGSPWVLGEPGRLVRILLHGLDGPLEVRDETWDQEMPALAVDDDDLAALLTYVRRAWGHEADPVDPANVRAIRAATEGREDPWTAAELRAIGQQPGR